MSRRTERMNDLLREEISRVLRSEVKDPRLEGLFSITYVEVSHDLRAARVFVSVLGTEEEKATLFQALHHASPFVRRELRARLRTRVTPTLDFRPDERIERGAEVLRLMREVGPHAAPEQGGDRED